MVEFLKQGLEYDLWANKQWLECLDRTQSGDPDRAIFRHILGSQLAWALRCEGNPPDAMPQPELTVETLTEINAKWLKLIEIIDANTEIFYKRFNGDPNKVKFSWMVRHVINHGTYHRGELRGLRRARNDEDFPDTDFVGYAFVTGAAEQL